MPEVDPRIVFLILIGAAVDAIIRIKLKTVVVVQCRILRVPGK